MGRPRLGKAVMSGAERQRRYMRRLHERAAAALAPQPPSRSALLATLNPERVGISLAEKLIELGWTFDRIDACLAAGAKTLARHREAAS